MSPPDGQSPDRSRGTPVRRHFDRIAGGYVRERYGPDADPWRAQFFSGRMRLALELIGPRPGRVLDLGSGPGVLADAIGAAGGRVFPLDLSPEMLSGAGPLAVVGDASRIPFRDGTFDTVVALGLTTYVADLHGLLREIARVLVPGGRLVISFTRRDALDTVLRGLFRATFGRRRRGRGVLDAGLEIHPRSDAVALGALARAGLVPDRIRGHNPTVFPFAYLARGPSLRLGRYLETRFDRRPPPLASDLVVRAEKRAGTSRAGPGPRRRVVRIIARLNVGGPARQAILLTRRLDPSRFESVLVTGRVAPPEGDMLPAARREGVEPVVIDGLGRAPSPVDDLLALVRLTRLLVRLRPAIVHTHTAKAGTLGRVAALLAGVPIRIHTFHGHVLHGYFSRPGSALVRSAERLLARITTRVIAVSEEVADDLAVRHRAIPRARIDVVPLGLPLGELLGVEPGRGRVRRELGLPEDALVVTWVGRLTAVKEPGLLLETFRRIAAAEPRAHLLVAGDGELRAGAEAAARAAGLGDRIRFLGWRTDLADLYSDSDLVLLTSRNEGTPVALIEAAAAAVPAVATRVGGVPSVVVDRRTGRLAAPGDAAALATAALELLADPAARTRMGAAAREHVRKRFSAERLLADLDRLYSNSRG